MDFNTFLIKVTIKLLSFLTEICSNIIKFTEFELVMRTITMLVHCTCALVNRIFATRLSYLLINSLPLRGISAIIKLLLK